MPTGRRDPLFPPPKSSVVQALLRGSRASPARIAAVYLAFSLLWIWLSDGVLIAFGISGELNFWAAAIKGTVFVSLSTVVVYLSARREVRVQRSSARLLEAVVNGTTDAVFVKDASGKYLLFNEGAVRLSGRPVGEVLGKDDTFLFDPDSASRVMARDRRILASGQSETAEEELTADDITRTYLATKAPYRDESGAVVGLIGISRDITDRKRAERALRESEERFRALVELAPDAIVLILNGRVAFANAAAARMVSAPSPEVLVGTSLTDHLHPDDRPVSLERQAAVVERNQVFPPHEVRIRRPGGSYIDVEICAGPCDVGGGRGIQVIARDVTDRKRDAALLMWQNATLERITSGEALPGVLEQIVRLVETFDPDTLASILLVDGEGRLRLGSAPSLPPEYNAAIDGVRIGPNVGSCGTAAHSREPVFVEDIATDPRWADFAALAVGHGLRACWSVPIFATSRGDDPAAVLGTFAIYARTPRAPTPHLVELLDRAGHLASIAVERDRADRELRESEARFRSQAEEHGAVLNAIPLHVALLDRAGVITAVNESWRAFARSNGLDPDRTLGADYIAVARSAVGPDSAEGPQVAAGVEAVLRGQRRQFRMRYTCHSPTEERWFEVLVSPLPDGGGAVVVHINFTEQSRAEAALRESAGRLRLALSAGRLGVWEWDLKTDTVFWSEEAFAIVGVDPHQSGSSLADFQRLVHPDDRDALWAKVSASLAVGGPAFDHEFRCVRPDGSVRWLLDQGQVSRDANGLATRMTGVVADITDRKYAESTRSRLAAIVESSEDAIYSKSLDGVIQSWNKGAERLFGYTEHEAVGRPVTILLPQDRLFEEDVISDRIVHGEPVAHIDTARVSKGGRRVNVSLTISPIRDAAGRVIAVSKIARDIGDRGRGRQRLAVQHAVASILADSDHLREAAQAILRTICETLGWAAGGVWMLDRERTRLAPVDVWGEGEGVEAFLTAGRRLTFARGVGLPGRVWQAGQGVWVPDVVHEPGFQRKAEAAQAGFQGAFAFPIRGGGDVTGVVEFFHTQTAPPDEELIRVFEVLGAQIGQFVERNRSRAALRESEGRLRLFVEHAPAALAMFDRDMRYMVASRRWVSDYRLTETDLVGRSHYDLFPDIPAEWRAVHARALAGEVVRAERDSFQWADGTTQWLRWEVRPWHDSAGVVAGIAMFTEDITARVQGEAALRENEERFRRLVDSIMDGVISIDADQRVILFNPAAERMFGLSAAEVLGGPLDRLLPVRHRAAHVGHVEAFRRDGVTSRSMGEFGAITALRKEGEEFPIEASISQIDVGGHRVSTAIVRDISARVRAESALRESEEQFRATFEQAAVGIAHVALDGRFVRVNERFTEITGFSREDLLTNTFQVITHPDDLLADLALVSRLLAGEIPHYALEKRYVRKAGGFVWVNMTVSLRRGAGGAPLHFISVVEDIAARKAAEAAVRESETRFRNLIEFLPDAIFLNVDGRVNFCNPACVRLFGASGTEELIGKTPFDLHPPEWHDLIRNRIATQATGEQASGIEEEVLRLDGRRVPVFVTALPVIDRGTRALLVVLHDLTEQKRVEAQLRHQELMIREAGELAHVGGWGFDPTTLKTDWTPEVARIYGLDPAEPPGIATALDFFNGERRPTLEAALDAAIRDGTPHDLELQLTATDGRRKWVRTICRPIVDNGKVVRVRGSIQDITDRKRAEEEIRELNAGLERRVRERTAELQAVNRELESFSYSVSHDLRAPIRHITAFASLVLESGGAHLSAEGRGHLEQVTRAAKRMGQLVDDLLRFSRLGRQSVQRQPIDTGRLVGDCLREVMNAADPRRFDTRVGHLPDCEGDPSLVRQVWLNLLANAVKYSGPRDPAVIEVGVEATPDGPAYFVRDNGVGFDMQYAGKLFGVFQRLHRAEEFEGTGIGLALVQRIVHRHGGRVWADSQPGHGATFYFTLSGGDGVGHAPHDPA